MTGHNERIVALATLLDRRMGGSATRLGLGWCDRIVYAGRRSRKDGILSSSGTTKSGRGLAT
jgi:hypothetical protein